MPDFSPDSTSLHLGKRSRAWFLAALTVVLFRAIPNLRFPIGRDQATHCVIGEGLLRGLRLYRDLWDNRPPGIFYIYALIVKLFGPVMWCVGVVDILWLLTISYCIFRFARRYLGVPAAALAMVFNAAWHCRQGYLHAAQPETFLILCVFVACFLLEPEGGQTSLRHIAAGALLGVAFWIKYNAAVFVPLVVFLPYLDARPLDRDSLRIRLTVPWRAWFGRAGRLGIGFVMVVVLVLAYFAATGAWAALKEVQFEALPRYGAMGFQWSLRFVFFALLQTYNHLGPWSEAMFAAALGIAWKRRELSQVTPVLLAACAGYVAMAVQGRFHVYYFETCYPFFAMLWGYVCVTMYEAFKLVRESFARQGWRVARLFLWLLLANLVYAPLPEEAVRVVQQYGFLADWWRNPEQSYAMYWWQLPLEKFPDQLRVINFLKKNSAPGDEVFVWGTAPLINFLSRRPPPTRFVSNLALISPWGPARWRDELVRDLRRKQPRFIVVARHDAIPTVSCTFKDSEQYLQVYPSLASLIRGEYRPVENLWDFEIYRLP